MKREIVFSYFLLSPSRDPVPNRYRTIRRGRMSGGFRSSARPKTPKRTVYNRKIRAPILWAPTAATVGDIGYWRATDGLDGPHWTALKKYDAPSRAAGQLLLL